LPYVSITEAADRIGCRPRDISDLLFARKIDPKRCLIKAGRRLLPESCIAEIRELLRRSGRAS
jgi:hypothetical protein